MSVRLSFARLAVLGAAGALLLAAARPGGAQARTLDKKVLSLSAAHTIAAAAKEAARTRGVEVVIVVVDDAGIPLLLERMDGAQVASVNVGIGKARTAAIYRRPSRVFEEQVRDGRVAALALADTRGRGSSKRSTRERATSATRVTGGRRCGRRRTC